MSAMTTCEHPAPHPAAEGNDGLTDQEREEMARRYERDAMTFTYDNFSQAAGLRRGIRQITTLHEGRPRRITPGPSNSERRAAQLPRSATPAP